MDILESLSATPDSRHMSCWGVLVLNIVERFLVVDIVESFLVVDILESKMLTLPGNIWVKEASKEPLTTSKSVLGNPAVSSI